MHREQVCAELGSGDHDPRRLLRLQSKASVEFGELGHPQFDTHFSPMIACEHANISIATTIYIPYKSWNISDAKHNAYPPYYKRR